MNMERLTTSRKWEDVRKDLKNELGYSHIWKRLNAIEDILGDDYDLDRLWELVTAYNEGRYIIMKDAEREGVSRLVELAEADRDGRVVVLPFSPPKTVYSCSKRFPTPQQAHYASAINILGDMDRGCVFGDTPEAAENALQRGD